MTLRDLWTEEDIAEFRRLRMYHGLYEAKSLTNKRVLLRMISECKTMDNVCEILQHIVQVKF